MNKTKLKTPEQVAADLYRLYGSQIKPDVVEANYLQNAADCLADIPKAEKAKGGKIRGYTADELRALAAQCTDYAKSVSDALRRLITAGGAA